MAERTSIRFNPVTKEIEIEGSEGFVKAYFNKLKGMISGTPKETAKEPKAVKARPAKKAKKEPKAKVSKTPQPEKTPKAAKKASRKKRVTNIKMVVELIQGSAEGISTAELKEKTGLADSQIWNIVNRSAKMGKIRKMKRGVYGAA